MKIFLVGMMGAGKSYWSRQLAKQLRTGGYDLDNIIELAEERTIGEIFEEEGEPAFRKIESRLLHWFGEKKTFVLATGGGTPCFHDNMKWMNEEGITIWIDEPVPILVERLMTAKTHRPLISGKTAAELKIFLEEKLQERTPFYAQAQYRLSAAELDLKNFKKIIQQHA